VLYGFKRFHVNFVCLKYFKVKFKAPILRYMDTKRTQTKATISRTPTLLQAVRAGFLMQGTSLHQFLKDSVGEENRRNAYRALKGQRNGPVARALRQQILDAAGVEHE